jgi:hypothetical protein
MDTQVMCLFMSASGGMLLGDETRLYAICSVR